MPRRPDEFDRPFEDVYLNAYPNPERLGCPGRDVLRRLAIKELPISHPAREHDYQQPVHLEAPAKRGTVAVTLPLGSEPGEYEVEVRHDRNGRAIKNFKSTAALSNQGKTVLQITADFSKLPLGDYIVAFRRGQQAWHFARLHIG
jgi:hypothetical protein